MSDVKPFPANGDDNGAVPASQSVAQALSAPSTESAGPADGNEAVAPVPQSDHGAGGKFVVGNQARRTHGLYVQRPSQPIDVSSTAARAAVILKVFESTARHAVRLAEAADQHLLRPRDGAALMQALDRLVAIEPQVRALSPSADAERGDATWEGWPARLAERFAGEPDAFCEFLHLLLQADRDRVGPLREQVRQVLNHFEPTGVPVWRGHKSDDDDSVLL